MGRPAPRLRHGRLAPEAGVSAGEGDAAPSLMSPSAPVCCWFCGEPEVVELAEMWGHQFMWETCWEALHESLCQQVANDPTWGRELLRRLGAEAFAGHRLRRVADDDGGGLVLDWQLRVRPVAFAAARAFVGQHHAHCAPPVTWRYGYAAFNGMTQLGVVMARNPVARAFMGRGIVEVNRLWAWFRIRPFWVTQGVRKPPAAGSRISVGRVS